MPGVRRLWVKCVSRMYDVCTLGGLLAQAGLCRISSPHLAVGAKWVDAVSKGGLLSGGMCADGTHMFSLCVVLSMIVPAVQSHMTGLGFGHWPLVS